MRSSNSYFQFKQFTIQQDRCAMKVCTDSCLFGALLPTSNAKNEPIQNVLEIGTGTGLLSLQYAQRNSIAQITTIEIEENAFQQANENISHSIFKDQIVVELNDFTTWQTHQEFDFIFSNPPFYENDVPSSNDYKNMAHHSSHLTIETILKKSVPLLNPNGILGLLIPFQRLQYVNQKIKEGHLWINQSINIYQTIKKETPFRTILFLTKKQGVVSKQNIYIKDGQSYTKEFAQLLGPFYLHL